MIVHQKKTPSLGVYMHGLTLHTAGWSREHARLCPTESSEAMPLPLVWFKPFDNTVTNHSRIQTPSVTRFSTPLYADTSCGVCHLGWASEKYGHVTWFQKQVHLTLP